MHTHSLEHFQLLYETFNKFLVKDFIKIISCSFTYTQGYMERGFVSMHMQMIPHTQEVLPIEVLEYHNIEAPSFRHSARHHEIILQALSVSGSSALLLSC